MGAVADKIERNRNLISGISQPLAVIGLEKIGQSVAGKLLTPAVWTADYLANGKTPGKVDIGLAGLGMMGGAMGPAAIVTGLVKAVVDDDMDNRLRSVRNSENPEFRPYIRACYHFALSSPQINAMSIASLGGTAWQHTNGLWVYILDKNNLHVPNFKPNVANRIYQPQWPLIRMSGGKVKWGTVYK